MHVEDRRVLACQLPSLHMELHMQPHTTCALSRERPVAMLSLSCIAFAAIQHQRLDCDLRRPGHPYLAHP